MKMRQGDAELIAQIFNRGCVISTNRWEITNPAGQFTHAYPKNPMTKLWHLRFDQGNLVDRSPIPRMQSACGFGKAAEGVRSPMIDMSRIGS